MKTLLYVTILLLISFQGISDGQTLPNIPDQVQKSWAYLIGTWDVTGQVGAETVQGTAKFSWSEGKHSYFGRQTWRLGPDGRTIHLSLLGGWNQATRETIEQGFSTAGDAATVRYRLPPDGQTKIEGTIEGVTDAGRTWSGSVTVTRNGDDEFELSSSLGGTVAHSLKYTRGARH